MPAFYPLNVNRLPLGDPFLTSGQNVLSVDAMLRNVETTKRFIMICNVRLNESNLTPTIFFIFFHKINRIFLILILVILLI